ncbi:MAG TPA: MarR family transcriptional regulator [Acidimicrobiales bacterium]|nr:MarR family transcriptional regulator [Acidimicrobiales bacterium]
MSSQQLAERVSHVTTRLARMLRQQDEGELTLTFRAALATIERRGPLTLGDLAAIEHMAPPTVTKVVTQLDERGLIQRTIDPDDRRVTRVSVSPAGAALLAADRKRRTEWLAGELRRLSADERERLAAAVEVLEGLTSTEMQRA